MLLGEHWTLCFRNARRTARSSGDLPLTAIAVKLLRRIEGGTYSSANFFSGGKVVDTCIYEAWGNLNFPGCARSPSIHSDMMCRVKCPRLDDSIDWVLLGVMQRTWNSQKSCTGNAECTTYFYSTKAKWCERKAAKVSCKKGGGL